MPKEPSPSTSTLELPTNGHQNGSAVAEIAVPDEIPVAQLQANELTVAGNGHTGWTPGFRAQTNPEKALKFPRRNSRAGQDVFETAEWEKRVAAITGETGKSVFEQKDCEIPKNWSQLATNVVVSKYFRGPMDSPQRETSVKQVIGRVADTIGDWGRQGGYFASEEDAQSFRDELAFYLLHQYGAFNSPVWFNLGVKGSRAQASACQPYDALVSTPGGLIPIGELVEKNAVGTRVFDAHGVARIVAVKANGVKNVLRIHTKAGYTLDVTADHLVWKMVSRQGGKWVEAGTLQACDALQWHRTPVIDKAQELGTDVMEAALAAWLQSDGFVGRYQGTNRSLTLEAMVVNADEEAWVRAALKAVFPDAHSHTRGVETLDKTLECRRIRVYGEFLAPFIQKWGLLARRHEMRVPDALYTAPLAVVAAYLRSLFQAEGYVSVRENAVVGLDMMGEEMMRGVQKLLLRFGIYSRLRHKTDARDDRAGMWSLAIRTLGDREQFASEIGFVGAQKAAKLAQSLELKGLRLSGPKTLQIERIEVRGEMPVFDIQTTSGEYLSGNIRVHNCFINSVYDDMESIMELAATEARLFKGGSGAGSNLWRIRSSREQLSGGGIASGPVSFMRGWDAFAGAIKSGGTCLAPHQRVYTENGPVAVEELAKRDEFITLSFDPPANRFKAKRARAWLAGRKRVVRVLTDKGQFDLSFDHPVKLSSGEYVQAGDLQPGFSLWACCLDLQHGHLRVHLRDGKKGKEFFHRLIAADVMGEDLTHRVVHHCDGNRFNNAPHNLQVMTQADHAAWHGRELAMAGEHPFQTTTYSHAGEANEMHRENAFWHSDAAQNYRETQGQILTQSSRAAAMQTEAARQKTLNTAFRILNGGWPIDSFEQYVQGRKLIVGRIASIVQLRAQIDSEFGSYEAFRAEVARLNHRVVSVETLGEMDVYDVEVQCPTPDDKSPQTGHNFLLWDGDDPTGSGVIVANTRRAAKMVILNADHPDIEEFIVCKADEEKKAWALIESGYNGGWNVPGGAYDSVAFQNANHSVRVNDDFMRAAENNAGWNTRAVRDGKVLETKNARQMLLKVAECTHLCGDPGLQYDSIINDWHTCANTDRIYASNPCCVTGDTLVAVADGRNAVAIRDLVGSEVPVYAHDHASGKTTISRMWNIEVKRQNVPIYRVTLDDDSSFRATDDHLIMLRDGSYRMVRDLRPSDALMPFHSKVLAPAKSRTKRRHIWTGGSWTPQYHAIWNYLNGEQPAASHIHHADFDALNDAIENLVLMSADAHNALHTEKMLGDNNPARRLMNEQWRQNIARAMSGENTPNFGKTHSPQTREKMSAKAAARWQNEEQRAKASQSAKDWISDAKEEGRKIGRTAGETFERSCPVCRASFQTKRIEQIFCGSPCRHSPLGTAMSGEKGGQTRAGRPENVELTRRAALTGSRHAILRAARALMDNGVAPSIENWANLRPQLEELGFARVPQASTVARNFADSAQLQDAAAHFNHKVASVEFCGNEDVYDGTVDTHHNFAILTSSADSCADGHQNFSGIFIHNSEFVFLDDTACVSRDTRVSTPDGLRTVEELFQAQQSGEKIFVTTDLVSENDHRRLLSHRRAFVTQTGEKQVFKIKLNDGRRIRATADHRFLTAQGWKRVDALVAGQDRIEIRKNGNNVAFNSDQSEVSRWQMLGWLTGDGVFSKGSVALVFGPDEMLTAQVMEKEFQRLQGDALSYKRALEPSLVAAGVREEMVLPRGGSHITTQHNGVLQITGSSTALYSYMQEWYGFKPALAIEKDVPSAVHRVADDLKIAYLQGLFSADGCIRLDGRGQNEEVMLASSSPELLRSVQVMLSDLGIASRIGWTHPQGRKNPQGQLHIYNQQARTFMSLIGFACSGRKQARAEEILSRPFNGQLKLPRAARVVSIVPDGIETVYDITEPVTHSFIAEGMVTHNCNLSSLNLLKFYDFETGHFDAETYTHACETFLTAQEIIVSFASYPTAKIAENSELFRPLGLGYCNIGALLMASGLAYDSDEGRALTGALTAIMTGAAYRQSAKIARNTGAFEGYAKNKEPMLRVIAKHRDAVNHIDKTLVADNVMQAARAVWDDALMLGQKHGYRNAQTTVLAPTGCLVGGSLVSTDKGLVRLEKLGNPRGEAWQDANFAVFTDGGTQTATKFFINGLDQTRKIATQAGYSIQGTLKHRVKVVNSQSGAWEWKRFADLQAGDLLPLAMNTLIGEAQSVALPPLGELHWNGEWNTKTPAHMSAELAEIVGYFMGDGSLHAKGLRFCVADGDEDVAARIEALALELFGLHAHRAQKTGYLEIALHSVSLALWWDAAGFSKLKPTQNHAGKGYAPRLPDAILHSNDRAIYGAFLRGLFEADGTLLEGVPALCSANADFAGEVRSLLLALGFPTSTKRGASQWGSAELHVLRLRNGGYNPQFQTQIGFMGARKSNGVIELKGALSGKRDRVFLPREVWNELVPVTHPARDAVQLALRRHGGVARQLASRIHAACGDERLEHALGYFFDEVTSNEDGGEQMTYDLSVPGNVTYVANGFVSHNTISFMMDADTTGIEPDIALVKYKKLVGGGLLKIVNQTVPAALRKLAYNEDEIKSIVDYIDKNDTIEGAPGLRDEHLSVFDCAFKAMNGTRSIHHMGHIKMMAAAQPFLSGAISKCVTGDTLIASTEGIFPIGSLYRGEKPGEFGEVSMTLASIDAPQAADLFYYGGLRPTKKLVLADGRSIEGTENHRVKVANLNGYGWKLLEDMELGDFVSVRLGAEVWAQKDADLLAKFSPSPLHTAQKRVQLPSKMTPQLARFLGQYIAEGNKTASNYMVRVTNNNPIVLDFCLQAARELFGLQGRIETDARNGVTSFVVASKTLWEFLDHIGAGGGSATKQIPWSVLRSTRECVAQFVGGLWLDGYVRGDGMTAICLNSPELLRQLQVVLNNFGLRAHLIQKYNATYDKHFGELAMHGADARRFAMLFRLDDAHKTAALAALCGKEKRVSSVHSDVIPAFKTEIQTFIKARRDTQRFRHVFDARTRFLSWQTMKSVADFYGESLFEAIPDLREILENNIHFVAVREISSEYSPVFDFQVPANHAFLGNGIINHNTVNMPQECSVEDIFDAYIQSWKLGVKAVAIYRDNSKRTQPLSTASDAQKADKKELEIKRANRRKLPDERQSITHKFSIAGQEGYFMVGLYEDGSPGELFIKMSKEGSTISGLMDSFAVSISMCLQYGVPLRVLVNKFSHTRFEPSGYTTNRDIPIAKSLMDYIFRWFDLKFHPNGDNGHFGKSAPVESVGTRPAVSSSPSGDERASAKPSKDMAGHVPTGSLFDDGASNGNLADAQASLMQTQSDSPPCPNCGAITVRSGACYKCNECGTTTGCG